jgi:hypothetical protein
MTVRLISFCVLSFFIICSSSAADWNRWSGQNGLTMAGGGYGSGTFEKLSKSEKPEDLEQAALIAIQEDLKYQLSILSSKIQATVSGVIEARENAFAAQAAYLEGLKNIPEIKELTKELAEANAMIQSGNVPRQEMREFWGKLRELQRELFDVTNENEKMKILKEARIAANSAFTVALRSALEDDPDYKLLQAKATQIRDIQKQLRDEQSAKSRIEQDKRRQANSDKRAKQKKSDEVKEKKAQDVRDF